MLNDNIKVSVTEEFRVQEKIRVSYLRNMGNLIAVIDEVGLPKEYVEKVILKFKRQSKEEVATLIANDVMEHLLLGYHSRCNYLRDMVKKLEAESKQLRSTCHSTRVRQMDLGEEFAGQVKHECLQCGELCDTYLHIDEKYMSLKLSTLDVLRKEDENLTKFCEKMGYTKVQKVEQAPKIAVTQIILPSGQKQVATDPAVVKSLERLNPIEQESLRLELEKSIHDIQEAEFTSSDPTE